MKQAICTILVVLLLSACNYSIEAANHFNKDDDWYCRAPKGTFARLNCDCVRDRQLSLIRCEVRLKANYNDAGGLTGDTYACVDEPIGKVFEDFKDYYNNTNLFERYTIVCEEHK